MTIETQFNTINHAGDGTTTVFAYDFRVDNSTDMKVYFDGAEQTIGWTIDGLGDPSGGNVTFTTAPADNVLITLLRQVPYTQQVDYRPFDPFPAETHELALDRLTMQTQQLLEEISRVIQAPPGAPPDVSYAMPAYDPGKGIMWSDQDPKRLVNSDDPINQIVNAAQIAAQQAAASAAAASGSETSAGASATKASQWADNDRNVEVETGKYSAKHWAEVASESVTPPGAIVIWPSGNIPTGWLHCNGAAVSRNDNAALFGVIGVQYGAGDGTTTFNLPDFRGVFVRGTDGGRGQDPDAASRTDRGDSTTGDVVGTKQAQETGPHAHTVDSGGAHTHPAQTGNSGLGSAGLVTVQSPSATTIASAGAHAHNLQNNTGSESRPVNIGMHFIIKT